MKSALTISSVLVVGTVTASADEVLAPPSTVAAERPRLVTTKLSPLATTETWGGGIRLTGLSGIGALPGVNIGGEVAGNVRYRDKFIELGLGRWTPQDSYYVAQGDAIVPLRLDVWALRAGWASMDMPLRAWVLFEVGELAGTPGMQAMPGVLPRMVMGDTPSERRWQAIGGGFGVAWPMSNQARLVGNMELAIPVAKDELMLGNYGAYEPDPLAARYSMGIEVGWR